MSAVGDTIAPTFVTQAQNTAVTTASSAPIVVNFIAPVATDNSGVTPTVTCNPASGSVFIVGSTPVTCTATDGSGNIAQSNFNVIVTVGMYKLSGPLRSWFRSYLSCGTQLVAIRGSDPNHVPVLPGVSRALSCILSPF